MIEYDPVIQEAQMADLMDFGATNFDSIWGQSASAALDGNAAYLTPGDDQPQSVDSANASYEGVGDFSSPDGTVNAADMENPYRLRNMLQEAGSVDPSPSANQGGGLLSAGGMKDFMNSKLGMELLKAGLGGVSASSKDKSNRELLQLKAKLEEEAVTRTTEAKNKSLNWGQVQPMSFAPNVGQVGGTGLLATLAQQAINQRRA